MLIVFHYKPEPKLWVYRPIIRQMNWKGFTSIYILNASDQVFGVFFFFFENGYSFANYADLMVRNDSQEKERVEFYALRKWNWLSKRTFLTQEWKKVTYSEEGNCIVVDLDSPIAPG